MSFTSSLICYSAWTNVINAFRKHSLFLFSLKLIFLLLVGESWRGKRKVCPPPPAPLSQAGSVFPAGLHRSRPAGQARGNGQSSPRVHRREAALRLDQTRFRSSGGKTVNREERKCLTFYRLEKRSCFQKTPLKLLSLKPERNIASKSNTGLKEVSRGLLKRNESTVNLQRDQTRGSKVVM